MKKWLISILFCIGLGSAVFAQTSNPLPGYVWTYFGATYGGGWGPSPAIASGIDIRSFGAICDGFTVDTNAINSAINSLPATGGQVLFPAATCVVANLVLPSRVTLRGQGPAATVLLGDPSNTGPVVASTNFASLVNTGSLGGIHNSAIYNMTINGNGGIGGLGGSRASGDCLDLYGIDFVIGDVELMNCPSVGFHSEWGNNDTVPVTLDNGSMESRYYNFKIHDTGGDGWDEFGPHDSHATNVVMYLLGGIGLNISQSANYAGGGLSLDNFHIYGNKTGSGDELVCNANNVMLTNGQLANSNGNGLTVTGLCQVRGAGLSIYQNVGSGISDAGVTNLSAVDSFQNNYGVKIVGGTSHVYSGLGVFQNLIDGLYTSVNDVVVTSLMSENNIGNGVTLSGAPTDITIHGQSAGNHASQIAFGTGLVLGNIQLVTFIFAGGSQVSYSGTTPLTPNFVSISSGGVGSLSSIFVHP